MNTILAQFDSLTADEQQATVDSLAKTIHEGAWMIMGGDWTFDKASHTDKAAAYDQAVAVLSIAATTDGDLAQVFYDTILALTPTTKHNNKSRNERYAKAKTEKTVQWFQFFAKGIII